MIKHNPQLSQRKRVSVFAISLITLGISLHSADANVVSSFEGPFTPGYSIATTTTFLGQSFLVSGSGQLSTVEFPVHDVGGAFNVKFSIWNAPNGVPGNELGAVIVASTNIPDSGQAFVPVDFSGLGITLTADVRYVVAAQVLAGLSNDQVRWATGEGNSPYADGRVFVNQNGVWNTSGLLSDLDLGFRVSVIPEPGTVGLVSLAGAIGLGLARPRKSRSGAGRG